MDPETLTAVGRVAGIAGIAIVVMGLVFRKLIEKLIHEKFLPRLTREQSYRLLRLLLLLPAFIAFAGIIAYTYGQKMQHEGSGVERKRREVLNGYQQRTFPDCLGAAVPPTPAAHARIMIRKLDGVIGARVNVPALAEPGSRNVMVREVEDDYVHIHLGEMNGSEEHYCIPFSAIRGVNGYTIDVDKERVPPPRVKLPLGLTPRRIDTTKTAPVLPPERLGSRPADTGRNQAEPAVSVPGIVIEANDTPNPRAGEVEAPLVSMWYTLPPGYTFLRAEVDGVAIQRVNLALDGRILQLYFPFRDTERTVNVWSREVESGIERPCRSWTLLVPPGDPPRRPC